MKISLQRSESFEWDHDFGEMNDATYNKKFKNTKIKIIDFVARLNNFYFYFDIEIQIKLLNIKTGFYFIFQAISDYLISFYHKKHVQIGQNNKNIIRMK